MLKTESPHSSAPEVPVESRECSKCHGPMTLSRIKPGRLKFDERTFECVKCDHVEKVFVAIDPIQSDVLGWFRGELRAPT